MTSSVIGFGPDTVCHLADKGKAITLKCKQKGQTIKSIPFASLGYQRTSAPGPCKEGNCSTLIAVLFFFFSSFPPSLSLSVSLHVYIYTYILHSGVDIYMCVCVVCILLSTLFFGFLAAYNGSFPPYIFTVP